jgi:hypothetical protein
MDNFFSPPALYDDLHMRGIKQGDVLAWMRDILTAVILTDKQDVPI